MASTIVPLDSIDIARTFGALLLGALFGSVLSGVVAVQIVIYFKLYPADSSKLKSLVLFVWFLDTIHTCFVWSAIWEYLIVFFGNTERIEYISWKIAITIAFTAVLTIAVHCFFANRIFMLSKRNWWLTIPIFVLAVLRLVSACATTAEMINTHSFPEFKERFRWLFTLGLALSSGVDILITGSLFVLLQTSRTGAASLNVVIDALIRYTFETGSLTCAGTVVSMLCYLVMGNNLIFLGLHFVIAKLYANSLLVTLNTRQRLRRARSSPSSNRDFPGLRLDTRRKQNSSESPMSPNSQDLDDRSQKESQARSRKLEINVERSVEYTSDNGPHSPPISVRFPRDV